MIYDMEWYDMIWYDIIWHYIIWYDRRRRSYASGCWTARPFMISRSLSLSYIYIYIYVYVMCIYIYIHTHTYIYIYICHMILICVLLLIIRLFGILPHLRSTPSSASWWWPSLCSASRSPTPNMNNDDNTIRYNTIS